MGKLDEYLANPPNYSEETVKALRYFKANFKQWNPGNPKPFEAVQAERLEGMRALVKDMAIGEGIAAPDVTAWEIVPGGYSGNSYYDHRKNLITMVGKLSVITLLHEFAHALLGRDEFAAQKWSLCLFYRVYPKAFLKLFAAESATGVFMTEQPVA